MIFKPYYAFETGCEGYLFGCVSEARCAVVDGREGDVDSYAQFAASKGLVISHVIDTHVHADHLSGGLSLARKVGAEYCLHESADITPGSQHHQRAQTILLEPDVEVDPVHPHVDIVPVTQITLAELPVFSLPLRRHSRDRRR